MPITTAARRTSKHPIAIPAIAPDDSLTDVTLASSAADPTPDPAIEADVDVFAGADADVVIGVDGDAKIGAVELVTRLVDAVVVDGAKDDPNVGTPKPVDNGT
jgi:hypothetical protein